MIADRYVQMNHNVDEYNKHNDWQQKGWQTMSVNSIHRKDNTITKFCLNFEESIHCDSNCNKNVMAAMKSSGKPSGMFNRFKLSIA